MDKSIVSQMKAIGGHIPVVSSWIDDDEETAGDVGGMQDKTQEAERLTEKINAQADEVAKLEKKLLEKDEEVVQYKQKIEKLEKQLEEKEPEQSKTGNNVKKTGKLLLAMSPKDAALIVADMKNEDIINLLETLDPDEMGKILAKMEPKRASELTTLLLAGRD